MSKRKAAETQQLDEPDQPKQPRADSASSPSVDVAVVRAFPTPLTAAHTLAMSRALTSKAGTLTQRLQAVVDLLKADAARCEPLIDWSLVPPDVDSAVVFQLLRFLHSCADGYGFGQKDRIQAQHLVHIEVMPLLPQLLRSFDPAAVSATTGNNALHEMCTVFVMSDRLGWPYELAEQLIGRGVSVNACNRRGRTPLLEYAATATWSISSANAMRLLLHNGADLNAQDNGGNGVLHYLIERGATELLENLCTGRGVDRLDCFISNAACQNPFDLLAARLAKLPDDQTASRMLQALKRAQASLWDKHTRPVLQVQLAQVLTVPDLAEMALEFVDGSERPSDRVVMQAEDDDSSAAAAAARS